MNHDEILQAAKEAGFEFKPLPRDLYCEVWLEQLERFTKIIERKTIERCAYVAEQGPDESEWTDDADYDTGMWNGYLNAGAAIRKLGEQ